MDASQSPIESKKRKDAVSKLKRSSKKRVTIATVVHEGCRFRYGETSSLKDIPFPSFVRIVDRLNSQTLRRYHRHGIPQAVLDELKKTETKLDVSWHTMHERLNEISKHLAISFLSEALRFHVESNASNEHEHDIDNNTKQNKQNEQSHAATNHDDITGGALSLSESANHLQEVVWCKGGRASRVDNETSWPSILCAIKNSRQWNWEREREKEMGMEDASTDCIMAMIPNSEDRDGSIMIRVGYQDAWKLAEAFELRDSTSSIK